MRPVLVVVPTVDAEHALEVASAEDESAVEAVSAESRTQRSAYALAFGAWTGVRITLMPSERKTSSKA